MRDSNRALVLEWCTTDPNRGEDRKFHGGGRRICIDALWEGSSHEFWVLVTRSWGISRELVMLQVNEQEIDLGLHFLANGLVWLSVGSSKEGSQQQQLLQHLSVLPKTHAVSSLLFGP